MVLVAMGLLLFVLYSVSTSYYATLKAPPPVDGESVVPKNAVVLPLPPSDQL